MTSKYIVLSGAWPIYKYLSGSDLAGPARTYDINKWCALVRSININSGSATPRRIVLVIRTGNAPKKMQNTRKRVFPYTRIPGIYVYHTYE